MTQEEIKQFLEEKVIEFNTPTYIETDPIQIPHEYSLKEDIEIASFITATIAWGKRSMIINNAHKIMQLMGNSPYDFVMTHKPHNLDNIEGSMHRTFNSIDLQFFITALKNIYTQHGGLEEVFTKHQSADSMHAAIHEFKKIFFSIDHPSRTLKHVSDPMKGSAAKRLHMMLRWLVRHDKQGVDFGIWKNIPMSKLSCPLDVHSGNISRKLGILTRKQNDAKALLELDSVLRGFDPEDPSKYDFALFGLGVFEKF